MSRLQESLEAYVRGELLEGADAYHCDKCNKKVPVVLASVEKHYVYVPVMRSRF